MMKPEIDPGVVAAFGSETRVRTLAVLAGASRPITAYRVGRVGGVRVPKVYAELARLAKAGLVVRRDSGWVLLDDDLRSLLRRRVRIRWDEDWDRAREDRAGQVMSDLRRIRASLKGVRTYDPNNRIPTAALRELERDPAKNQILQRMGVRPSVRKV